jgi:hypothetical protein
MVKGAGSIIAGNTGITGYNGGIYAAVTAGTGTIDIESNLITGAVAGANITLKGGQNSTISVVLNPDPAQNSLTVDSLTLDLDTIALNGEDTTSLSITTSSIILGSGSKIVLDTTVPTALANQIAFVALNTQHVILGAVSGTDIAEIFYNGDRITTPIDIAAAPVPLTSWYAASSNISTASGCTINSIFPPQSGDTITITATNKNISLIAQSAIKAINTP